jgi:hypothetical protein
MDMGVNNQMKPKSRIELIIIFALVLLPFASSITTTESHGIFLDQLAEEIPDEQGVQILALNNATIINITVPSEDIELGLSAEGAGSIAIYNETCSYLGGSDQRIGDTFINFNIPITKGNKYIIVKNDSETYTDRRYAVGVSLPINGGIIDWTNGAVLYGCAVAGTQLFAIDSITLDYTPEIYPSYQDNFTRANSETVGGNWTEYGGGDWKIDTNTLYFSTGDDSEIHLLTRQARGLYDGVKLNTSDMTELKIYTKHLDDDVASVIFWQNASKIQYYDGASYVSCGDYAFESNDWVFIHKTGIYDVTVKRGTNETQLCNITSTYIPLSLYQGFIQLNSGTTAKRISSVCSADNTTQCDSVLLGGSIAECSINADCGICQYCNAGTCNNQSDVQDLKNECNANYNCVNPYIYSDGTDFCNGLGSCASTRDYNVTSGNVCINATNYDVNPTNAVNCAIWNNCIADYISANQFFTGYSGNGSATCSITDWQSTGSNYTAPYGYKINATSQGLNCSINPVHQISLSQPWASKYGAGADGDWNTFATGSGVLPAYFNFTFANINNVSYAEVIFSENNVAIACPPSGSDFMKCQGLTSTYYTVATSVTGQPRTAYSTGALNSDCIDFQKEYGFFSFQFAPTNQCFYLYEVSMNVTYTILTPECSNNTDCGLCQYCNGVICKNQTSIQDLKNECSNTTSCANPYTYGLLNGFCNGAGSCSASNPQNVTSGNVCINETLYDTNPTNAVNCAIWYDCVSNYTTANEYLTGYTGDNTPTCTAFDWIPTGGSLTAPNGSYINLTSQGTTCNINTIPLVETFGYNQNDLAPSLIDAITGIFVGFTKIALIIGILGGLVLFVYLFTIGTEKLAPINKRK